MSPGFDVPLSRAQGKRDISALFFDEPAIDVLARAIDFDPLMLIVGEGYDDAAYRCP